MFRVSHLTSSVLGTEEGSESEVAQSCPTLCDSMDCSPPGFSIHGVFQARILEWLAISLSGEYSYYLDVWKPLTNIYT